MDTFIAKQTLYNSRSTFCKIEMLAAINGSKIKYLSLIHI
mgnify:CR=1 FL=1